jgi:hypothetical protein
MSSEFIVDDVTESCDREQKWGETVTYVLIAIVVVLIIAVIVNTYGPDCAAFFQGAFPERSDIGAGGKFDLQKEINYLNEKQMTNLSFI